MIAIFEVQTTLHAECLGIFIIPVLNITCLAPMDHLSPPLNEKPTYISHLRHVVISDCAEVLP
jgi:hypothetical protein